MMQYGHHWTLHIKKQKKKKKQSVTIISTGALTGDQDQGPELVNLVVLSFLTYYWTRSRPIRK